MKRSSLGLVAIALTAVVGVSGCSSSGESTKDVELRLQNQINGLQERVTSLESRMAWVEVVGRKVIQSDPTAFEEELVADVARLEAQFATAQTNAAAVADKVATEKAAAEKAVAEAKAAVDAAVAAEKADDAAQAAAIEAAAAKVAAARTALEELKQKIQDALGGTVSPSPTSS